MEMMMIVFTSSQKDSSPERCQKQYITIAVSSILYRDI